MNSSSFKLSFLALLMALSVGCATARNTAGDPAPFIKPPKPLPRAEALELYKKHRVEYSSFFFQKYFIVGGISYSAEHGWNTLGLPLDITYYRMSKIGYWDGFGYKLGQLLGALLPFPLIATSVAGISTSGFRGPGADTNSTYPLLGVAGLLAPILLPICRNAYAKRFNRYLAESLRLEYKNLELK
jgi:hypothetical protein